MPAVAARQPQVWCNASEGLMQAACKPAGIAQHLDREHRSFVTTQGSGNFGRVVLHEQSDAISSLCRNQDMDFMKSAIKTFCGQFRTILKKIIFLKLLKFSAA